MIVKVQRYKEIEDGELCQRFTHLIYYEAGAVPVRQPDYVRSNRNRIVQVCCVLNTANTAKLGRGSALLCNCCTRAMLITTVNKGTSPMVTVTKETETKETEKSAITSDQYSNSTSQALCNVLREDEDRLPAS